ncbi:MAG: CDP-glucose 4,6-dehydratase, partial [Bacteroidales bacterium]|nr:CDP-glucose 4,6-dehydratase [Bacteroidales bacterium]
VEEMTQMATEIWGGGTFVFPRLTNQPHEAGLLSLDITKAGKMLGWRPHFNARKALEMTLEWYKAFYSNPSIINELTAKQIRQFDKM